MPLAEGSEKAPIEYQYYIIPVLVIRQLYFPAGKVIHHYLGGSLKKIYLTHQNTSCFVKQLLILYRHPAEKSVNINAHKKFIKGLNINAKGAFSSNFSHTGHERKRHSLYPSSVQI